MKEELRTLLKDTFIKNDFGECRALYILLCLKAGLHENYPPEEYKWSWIFESGLGVVQHAPERKYVRTKRRLIKEELFYLYYRYIKLIDYKYKN